MVPERSNPITYFRFNPVPKEHTKMTYSPFKPTLPKDFAAPALLPLDPDKSDVCLNSASEILGKSNEIKGQISRTSCMASYSV